MVNTLNTVYDIMKATPSLRFSGDRVRGEFGIEIETETTHPYDYPNLKMWRCERDNSLRDFGCEYVLKAPMNLPDIEKALEEFNSCNKKFKFKNSSVSTSIHVHVNMLNDSFLSMANFITAYAMVENLLIRYSGPDRLSNLFCLPMIDCEGVASTMTNILRSISRNSYKNIVVSTDRVKYGAINPAPLTKLGTLEVRSFRGETDIKVISNWINIIKKLKDFSRREGLDPVKIVNLWKSHKDNILEVIFEDYADLLRIPGTNKVTGKGITFELIESNLKFACDFASIRRDWKDFGVLKVLPVYKEKIKDELEAISRDKFNYPFESLSFPERMVVIETYHRNNPTQRIVDATTDI